MVAYFLGIETYQNVSQLCQNTFSGNLKPKIDSNIFMLDNY